VIFLYRCNEASNYIGARIGTKREQKYERRMRRTGTGARERSDGRKASPYRGWIIGFVCPEGRHRVSIFAIPRSLPSSWCKNQWTNNRGRFSSVVLMCTACKRCIHARCLLAGIHEELFQDWWAGNGNKKKILRFISLLFFLKWLMQYENMYIALQSCCGKKLYRRSTIAIFINNTRRHMCYFTIINNIKFNLFAKLISFY